MCVRAVAANLPASSILSCKRLRLLTDADHQINRVNAHGRHKYIHSSGRSHSTCCWARLPCWPTVRALSHQWGLRQCGHKPPVSICVTAAAVLSIIHHHGTKKKAEKEVTCACRMPSANNSVPRHTPQDSTRFGPCLYECMHALCVLTACPPRLSWKCQVQSKNNTTTSQSKGRQPLHVIACCTAQVQLLNNRAMQ